MRISKTLHISCVAEVLFSAKRRMTMDISSKVGGSDSLSELGERLHNAVKKRLGIFK